MGELTGMQIFKYLPAAKKAEGANCKKCGFPTCMAFALKLAKKQADIEKCDFVPDELKEKFCEASKIQQHVVKLGCNSENTAILTGGETVMFRHDKTFVNRTVIAIALDTDAEDFEEKVQKIKAYGIERIGEKFNIDAVLLSGSRASEAKATFEQAGIAVLSRDLFVTGENIEQIEEKSAALTALKGAEQERILELEYGNVSQACNTRRKGTERGEGIFCGKTIEHRRDAECFCGKTKEKSVAEVIEQLTLIRRAAILKRHEPLTWSVLVQLPKDLDPISACAVASLLVCRYAGIIVLNDFNEALLSTLFTLRQNIYTNPQKPLQVEAKVYEFNEPSKDSPVLLTTNFALTYFAVAGELEALPFGSYLVVTPSDGMSVLTAWSADKFTADLVAKSIRDYDLANKVNTRSIIIPGLLSHMKVELEEALPEWEIVVGTIEACRIPEFLKQKSTDSAP